jgi:hypothetical protein
VRLAGSTLAFVALTFLGTEPLFIAAAWVSRGRVLDALPGLGANALVLLGTFAPALVALGLTAKAEGGDGVRALLGTLSRWKRRSGDLGASGAVASPAARSMK